MTSICLHLKQFFFSSVILLSLFCNNFSKASNSSNQMFSNVVDEENGISTEPLPKLFNDNLLCHHLDVAERFDILELLYADNSDDLGWFLDKLESYKNDPNHFFLLLSYTIFINQSSFTTNEKLLCQYFLRVYKNYDLKILDSIFVSEYADGFDFLSVVIYHLQTKDYYDILVPFLLKDPQLFASKLNFNFNLHLIHFRIHFYYELINGLGFNSDSDSVGINNFLILFEANQEINYKAFLVSRFFFTDKAENILTQCLKKISMRQDQITFLTKSLEYFFQTFFHFSFVQINFDSKKIFRRILKIVFKASSDRLIEIYDFENFRLLNEIYFGSEEMLTLPFISSIIEENRYKIFDFVNSAINLNRPVLFFKLLNLNNFIRFIQVNSVIYANNLSLYFKLHEALEQNSKLELPQDKRIFGALLIYYDFIDIEIVENNAPSCYFVLRLKPKYHPDYFDNNNNDKNLNNGTINFPMVFKYNYYYEKSPNEFKNVLIKYSGSNEESLAQFIAIYSATCCHNSISGDYYFNVSDNIIKMLSSSKKLQKLFSEIIFAPQIKSKQLMRLLKTQCVTLEDLLMLTMIHYDFFNFDYCKDDLDFVNMEILMNKSIGDYIFEKVEILLESHKDTNEIRPISFENYFKIRKALLYLLKSEKLSIELLKLDKSLLEFLQKEAPKDVDLLIKFQSKDIFKCNIM